jgi:magnesium-transporting ATPase (P-type)
MQQHIIVEANMNKVKSDPVQVVWHSVSAEVSLENLQSSATGLDQEDAAKRLATHGANRLPQAARRSAFTRLLVQFHNILIYVLIASAVITGFLEHWIDTSVILAVVIANAIIGFVQEGKAEQAMEAIRHMLAPQANVLRG